MARTMRARLQMRHLNPSRVYLDRFIAEAAASIPAGARVLDAGAGEAPYRHHFSSAEYESADFAQIDKPYATDLTYVCDLSEIPVEDNRYDLVLLTQVLEHVPEPTRILKELHRVLKPGGTLWLSAPLYYPEHEQPYDFFRYTQFAHRHLLAEAGFEVQRLDWMEGYLTTLAYQMQLGGWQLPFNPRAYGGGLIGTLTSIGLLPLRVVLILASMPLTRVDLRHKVSSSGHPKNYCLVASAR